MSSRLLVCRISGTANAGLVSGDVVFFVSGPGVTPHNRPSLLVMLRVSPSTTTCRLTPRSMRLHRCAAKSAGHLRHWLIYGTGGAAFAHVENSFISTEIGGPSAGVTFVINCSPSPCSFAAPTTNTSHNTSGGTTMFGWAAGGGIDWKYQLDAGSALVFGVEYLHYGFPEQTISALGDNATAQRERRRHQRSHKLPFLDPLI